MKLLSVLSVLFASIKRIQAELASDGKCRILAMRGGGSHGAYEAGAVRAIFDNLPEQEIQYDYYSGVSIGAMNASILALYPKGEE